MQPLIMDLPYPSIDILTKDVRSGQIISFAYATLRGEISATLQYVYHHFFMEQTNKDNAETLMRIAVAEMKHIDILGTAMLKLGVDPKYVQCPNTQNYYNTSVVSQSKTPQKMILDDIQGEMNAITDYQKMLFVLKNEQVAAIIERIIMDEQLHVETLKKMLQAYSNPTYNV
ncbi:MAG: manganese catalase family protein [Clostridia bacterium]|nr:manganese catalase family protein [Clostridia bacterium]